VQAMPSAGDITPAPASHVSNRLEKAFSGKSYC